jgi:hypothetical protein
MLWLVVITVGGVAVATGTIGPLIEVLIMVGIPLYVIAQGGRAYLRSAAGLRSRPSSSHLLTAGRYMVRALPRFGGGFYGLVATITFLAYQIREVGDSAWFQPDAWGGAVSRASTDPFAFLTQDLAMMLWDVIFPVSANWIVGLVHAAIWPVFVLQWGGFWALGAVVLLGIGYARVMPRIWPVVLARVAVRDARLSPQVPPDTDTSPPPSGDAG